MEERHSLIKLRVPVLDWQLHFPGVLRVPESSTCHGGIGIPVETGRPLSSSGWWKWLPAAFSLRRALWRT